MTTQDTEEPLPRLLLVDDDAVMRRSAGRFLARAGFDVVGAESARAALDRIERGERFDVAVLDLQMPDMTGAELLVELARRVPELPCGIWSASPSLHELDPDVQRLACFLVSKTTRIVDLVVAVRRAVEQGPPSRDEAGGRRADRAWGLSTGVRRKSEPPEKPVSDVG